MGKEQSHEQLAQHLASYQQALQSVEQKNSKAGLTELDKCAGMRLGEDSTRSTAVSNLDDHRVHVLCASRIRLEF